MPVIPAPRRLGHKDQEFKASLDYISKTVAQPSPKQTNTQIYFGEGEDLIIVHKSQSLSLPLSLSLSLPIWGSQLISSPCDH
jgi:hypothetical protein